MTRKVSLTHLQDTASQCLTPSFWTCRSIVYMLFYTYFMLVGGVEVGLLHFPSGQGIGIENVWEDKEGRSLMTLTVSQES